jgi:hypothetical protein
LITIHGVVDVPAAIRTHVDPPDMEGAKMPSGTALTLNVSPFRNTGNVVQRLHATVGNPVNCTATNPQFTLNGVDKVGDTIDLNPGQEAALLVVVETPPHSPGEDVGYSFEVTPTWS